jgi:hypothetical protein
MHLYDIQDESGTFDGNLISTNFDETNNFVFDEHENLHTGVSFSVNSDSNDSIADIDVANIINNARKMLKIVGKSGEEDSYDKLSAVYDENNIIEGYEVINDVRNMRRFVGSEGDNDEYNVIKLDKTVNDENNDSNNNINTDINVNYKKSNNNKDNYDKALNKSDDHLFHDTMNNIPNKIDDLKNDICSPKSKNDTYMNSYNHDKNPYNHLNDFTNSPSSGTFLIFGFRY